MAFKQNLKTFSAVAGEDLSSAQYHFVKLDASNEVVLCDTEGEPSIGILQNAPESGEIAEVGYDGVSKVEFGDTIVGTDALMTTSAGKAMVAAAAAAPGVFVMGKPLSSGATGEIHSILLDGESYLATGDSTHASTDGSSHADVVTNSAHVAGDGSDHADVATNSAHVAGDGSDHADVATNTAGIASNVTDIASLDDQIVDAVIAVADTGGGGTDAALTVGLQDRAAASIARAVCVMILGQDTAGAGFADLNANVTFATATTGSILASGSGWALVKTDATGDFACTASNSSDETVHFTVVNPMDVDALANGVFVRGCVNDSATWAA